MMDDFKKNIIIYAHPSTKGHCYEILMRVQENFRDRGLDFVLIDLYAINYDPILKAEEHYSAGNKLVAADTLRYQEMIQHASTIIFIFPIWWGHMPAILKGFVDRTFTPGFSFKFKRLIGNIYVPRGFLQDKKALVFMTSGTPFIVYFFRCAVSPKTIIKKMIFNVIGMKAKIYTIYDATNLEKNRSIIAATVKRGVEWLYSSTP